MFILGISVFIIFLLILVFSNLNNQNSKTKQSRLVLYYAPWCGHCKNFMPIYEEFSDKAKNEYPTLSVEMINCVENKCPQEIRGYPTVRYLEGEKQVDFKGPRTIEGLHTFIQNN